MFTEGEKVIYLKTKEVAIIEDVNNDSYGEWYFISINNGDCFAVDACELKGVEKNKFNKE